MKNNSLVDQIKNKWKIQKEERKRNLGKLIDNLWSELVSIKEEYDSNEKLTKIENNIVSQYKNNFFENLKELKQDYIKKSNTLVSLIKESDFEININFEQYSESKNFQLYLSTTCHREYRLVEYVNIISISSNKLNRHIYDMNLHNIKSSYYNKHNYSMYLNDKEILNARIHDNGVLLFNKDDKNLTETEQKKIVDHLSQLSKKYNFKLNIKFFPYDPKKKVDPKIVLN